MKRRITVELDPDTAAFLEFSRAQKDEDDTSAFINSLLRQERFRQGFPAHSKPGCEDYAAIPISRKRHEMLDPGFGF